MSSSSHAVDVSRKEGTTLGHEKLRELTLYIADASMGDPLFGKVKLQKILFNADFAHFKRTGAPITGEEYRKKPYGPMATALTGVLQQGEIDGELVIRREGGAYGLERVIPLREANLELFTAEEIAQVDRTISAARGMNGTEMSNLSHRFLGWQIADEKEPIPYESAYLFVRPMTDAEEAVVPTLQKVL